MEYELFVSKTVEALQNKLGDSVKVKVMPVTKNNGIVLDGIVFISTDKNITPTIYIEYYFKDYEKGNITHDEVVSEIIDIYNQDATFDASKFLNFQAIKDHITYRLVNTGLNILNDVPHRNMLDLSIVYYVVVQVMGETGYILIHNNHLEYWNVTEQDLYQYVSNNTRRLLPEETLFLNEMFPFIDDSVEIYILTNEAKSNGATVILYPNTLENLAEKLDANLVLLPSSVNEWLIMPDDGNNDEEYLSNMIQEINSTDCVDNIDILSDHPYYYNRETKMLTGSSEKK